MNTIFLSGETIDLCVPQEEDFTEWASWFNDQKITQFLQQGRFPNTVKDQRNFYESATRAGRFVTLIKSKEGELLGVFSLSEIDIERKNCQVSYVCPKRTNSSLLAPLEALALGTEHAFLRLGMERVSAGHAFPGLLKWIQKTEILGYQAEGIVFYGFSHGTVIADVVRTSVTKKQFITLYERRGKRLWPGEGKARRMIAALRKNESLAEKISTSIHAIHREHDQIMEQIERGSN